LSDIRPPLNFISIAKSEVFYTLLFVIKNEGLGTNESKNTWVTMGYPLKRESRKKTPILPVPKLRFA